MLDLLLVWKEGKIKKNLRTWLEVWRLQPGRGISTLGDITKVIKVFFQKKKKGGVCKLRDADY